jgi:superfamily II DNA or RNA helicase
MQLRPYQITALDAVRREWSRGVRSTVVVAATGAGKTNMFLDLLLGPDGVLQAGARGLILAHRAELLAQPVERIAQLYGEWQRSVGVVKAEQNEVGAQLVVASIQTLTQPRRMAALLAGGPIDYVVTDECHHATAAGYTGVYAALWAKNAEARHLGVTATPFRSDGVGLGTVFETVAAKITIRDLVPTYLVPPRWLGIATGISVKGVDRRQGEFVQRQLADVYETANCFDLVVATHLKYARGRKAMAFTSSVKGAYALAARFERAGIRAAAADGSTPAEVRANVLHLLRSGGVEVVINANLWTEGLDVPEISCIHVVTPCGSDGRYTQIVGRGLRPFPGKVDCLIFDYLPQEPRNICMLGDVLGVPARIAVKAAPVGEVMGGFTFDGKVRSLRGDPLELLARDLGYLDASPFCWDQHDGWLLLGLGPNAQQEDRTLVLTPPCEGRPRTLLLITRRGFGSSRISVLRVGDVADLAETAQQYAEQHGNGAFI